MPTPTRKPTIAEYMCRNCGIKKTQTISSGRPSPGICPRKTNRGPHSWVLNRKY